MHTLILVLVLPVVASAADEKAADKVLAKMAGDWTTTRAELNGTKASDQTLANLRFTIKGDKFILNEKATFTLKLDPSATPPLVDVTSSQNQVYEGIYELKGDVLRICVQFNGGVKQRPTEFNGGENTGQLLLELKRQP
jgi:uncharacterized protein (TIGR03067 family)